MIEAEPILPAIVPPADLGAAVDAGQDHAENAYFSGDDDGS